MITLRHFVLLLFFSTVFASVIPSETRIKKETSKRLVGPRYGWVSHEQPIASRLSFNDDTLSPTTTLTIALKQRNMDKLTRIAWDVSDPFSDQYGQHLTFDEMVSLVKPAPETVRKVRQWLGSHGVTDDHLELTASEDFLIAHKVPVAHVERLLDITLQPYIHPVTRQIIYRTTQHYSVPGSISPLIDYINGINSFPRVVRNNPPPLTDLPSGNGPVISRILAGDSQVGSFFLLRCKDGTAALNPTSPCTSSSQGSGISSFQMSTMQKGWNPNPITSSFSYPQLDCNTCTGWVAQSFGSFSYLCNMTIQEYNVSSSAVFCASPATTGVRNYLPFTVNLSVTFSDGTSSSTTNSTTDIYAGQFVTPKDLTDLYGVPAGYQALTGTQAVAEFLQQYYSPSDLSLFFSTMGLPQANVTLIGPNDPTQPGGEASLDIQYIMGIAPNATTYFWSVGGVHDGQEPFDVWMTQVLNTPNAPYVHSVSYGDDEPSLSSDFMNRVDFEFQKAASRGLSLLFASGDNGVNSGDGGPGCPNNTFVPSFPPTSPYVTAVGATQLSTQTRPVCDTKTINNVPIFCNQVGEITSSTMTGSRITSGGGFSNYFGRPPYQEEEVTNYLAQIANVTTPTAYFNSSGRAYPDIAALGRNYLVVIDGSLVPVDGTSAATPTFAGIITLLNGILLASGVGPLGFLNPLIYAAREFTPLAFTDIVMGNNRCGENVPYQCCEYGFPATLGWDAVTGYGTPNFGALVDLVTQFRSK